MSRDRFVSDDPGAEEYEHIPWAQLASQQAPDRTRIVTAVAGVAAAVVLGVFGARVLAPEPATTVVDPAVVTPPTSQPIEPLPLELDGATTPAGDPPGDLVTTTAVPPESTVGHPILEADLMAVAGDGERALAAMSAERFVSSLFTFGAAPGEVDVLRHLLPAGLDQVPLPHDATGDGWSHVEWVDAFRAEPDETGGWTVSVAYRRLSYDGDERSVRTEEAAVDVGVIIDEHGAPFVAGFPTAVTIPGARAPDPGYVSISDAPPDALAAFDALGVEVAEPHAVREIANGWRFIVLVRDAAGFAWPYELTAPRS